MNISLHLSGPLNISLIKYYIFSGLACWTYSWVPYKFYCSYKLFYMFIYIFIFLAALHSLQDLSSLTSV